MHDRPQMITFAEMRVMGVRGRLIYCADYRCSHSIVISGDLWPDDLRLSDIEPQFFCKARGHGQRILGALAFAQAPKPAEVAFQ
jgi:hypothetical protein